MDAPVGDVWDEVDTLDVVDSAYHDGDLRSVLRALQALPADRLTVAALALHPTLQAAHL